MFSPDQISKYLDTYSNYYFHGYMSRPRAEDLLNVATTSDVIIKHPNSIPFLVRLNINSDIIISFWNKHRFIHFKMSLVSGESIFNYKTISTRDYKCTNHVYDALTNLLVEFFIREFKGTNINFAIGVKNDINYTTEIEMLAYGFEVGNDIIIKT